MKNQATRWSRKSSRSWPPRECPSQGPQFPHSFAFVGIKLSRRHPQAAVAVACNFFGYYISVCDSSHSLKQIRLMRRTAIVKKQFLAFLIITSNVIGRRFGKSQGRNKINEIMLEPTDHFKGQR